MTPIAAAAERRRRVLAVLVGVLLVTVTVAALGRAPMWLVVLPAAAVVGFLYVARRQVAYAADMARRRERRATLAEAARAAEARYGAAEATVRRGGRAVDPAPQVEKSRIVARELLEDDLAPTADGAWHAVPTTLPTYVTAPRATRMPRVIDLTHPGAWTGAAMMEQARSTLAAHDVQDGEMRVETFEITVPRDPAVRAGVTVEPTAYAERYVEDDSDSDPLVTDDLDTLLEDPRTGVDLPPAALRRAANG